jgi:hypothetical protein
MRTESTCKSWILEPLAGALLDNVATSKTSPSTNSVFDRAYFQPKYVLGEIRVFRIVGNGPVTTLSGTSCPLSAKQIPHVSFSVFRIQSRNPHFGQRNN